MRFFTRCVVVLSALLFLVAATNVEAAKKSRKVKRATVQQVAEPPLPHYRLDASGKLVPDLRAAAAIIFDIDTREIVWSENADTQRSIASITKLMTALVAFEDDLLFTMPVTITKKDVFRASTTHLRAGDRVSVEDLLHLTLIASDNVAARALARVSSYGAAFVDRMNVRAREMGLTKTTFADPAGLLSSNKSSAFDVARLLTYITNNEYLARIMSFEGYSVFTSRRNIAIKNTNRLIANPDMDVLSGKTGYTRSSGFCLATVVRVKDRRLAIVVLGARTNKARFNEAENLVRWLTHDDVPIATEAPTCGPYPQSVSDAGVLLIKDLESFRATPYRDAGGYAVGYGAHKWKGRKVTRNWPRRVTEEQAHTELMRQLDFYGAVVQGSVCAQLSQSAYDGLVSLAYNLGRVNTRIVEKVERARPVTLQDFLTTATVNGRAHWVLEARRLKEFALFAGDTVTALNTAVRSRMDVFQLYRALRNVRVSLN